MSRDELARTIPVRPPIVNRKINPKAHSIGGSHLIVPPCKVANQLKTLTVSYTHLTLPTKRIV